MEGEIDKAFKHTTAYYPQVLEDNPDIVFHLKCRKYVEMMRRCSELHNTAPEMTSSSLLTESPTNGHADVFGEDMELDDENQDDNDSCRMTKNSNRSGQPKTEQEYHDVATDSTKYEELLQDAISYGQTLMREYRNEKKEYRKTLENIFSLIAYDDAKASVHGHLLETGGRLQVAEELNSAILGMRP